MSPIMRNRTRKRVPLASVLLMVVFVTAPTLGTAGKLPDENAGYVVQILMERQAADQKMRDRHYSPLAMTHLVLLKSEPLSIGSDPEAGLVLPGPAVAAHHAEVVTVQVDGHERYKIRSLDGPIHTDTEDAAEVTEMLLEKDGHRLRIGRDNIVYYRESSALGPMIRVLNFESPAYTLFEGLAYFPVDPSYRVEATIDAYDEPKEIQIVDTMGFVSSAWIYGTAAFTLAGKPSQLKLVLFTPEPTEDSVFYVIFGDKTNGRETYGAGRYLLPDFVPSGSITLDFNRSVNPSCAYNGGFACPMPPPGNRFPFPVPAGIKDYAHRPPR